MTAIVIIDDGHLFFGATGSPHGSSFSGTPFRSRATFTVNGNTYVNTNPVWLGYGRVGGQGRGSAQFYHSVSLHNDAEAIAIGTQITLEFDRFTPQGFTGWVPAINEDNDGVVWRPPSTTNAAFWNSWNDVPSPSGQQTSPSDSGRLPILIGSNWDYIEIGDIVSGSAARCKLLCG